MPLLLRLQTAILFFVYLIVSGVHFLHVEYFMLFDVHQFPSVEVAGLGLSNEDILDVI